jgi:hypothetical protein
VDKRDYMLLQRQIVKALGKQTDIEDSEGMKFAFTRFHSIAWMTISVNVTIYRTNTLSQGFQNSHFITTAKLRSRI